MFSVTSKYSYSFIPSSYYSIIDIDLFCVRLLFIFFFHLNAHKSIINLNPTGILFHLKMSQKKFQSKNSPYCYYQVLCSKCKYKKKSIDYCKFTVDFCKKSAKSCTWKSVKSRAAVSTKTQDALNGTITN